MKTLGTAGFDLKMADTPAKLECIKQLPQLYLAQVEHKGRQVYVYMDAQGCQCLYTGNENAYRLWCFPSIRRSRVRAKRVPSCLPS